MESFSTSNIGFWKFHLFHSLFQTNIPSSYYQSYRSFSFDVIHKMQWQRTCTLHMFTEATVFFVYVTKHQPKLLHNRKHYPIHTFKMHRWISIVRNVELLQSILMSWVQQIYTNLLCFKHSWSFSLICAGQITTSELIKKQMWCDGGYWVWRHYRVHSCTCSFLIGFWKLHIVLHRMPT